MQFISTSDAPTPAGHYSQAVVSGNFIFVSGQLPIKPGSEPKSPGPIAEQTRQVLANLKNILEAAGSGLAHVVKTTIYISDISMWGDVNHVYAEFFGDHKPARAVVPTRELHFDYQIEMEAIALKP
jgi:2-iminobutanoate/2-iminopropanoate deaminase